MDIEEAAVAVLREAGEPLHWTVIQDRALRAGYVDPFVITDVRGKLLAALAAAARSGRVSRCGKGVYELP